MFRIECPRHGRAVLLPPDRIAALRRRADGVDLDWRCWCGTRGTTRIGRVA